MKRLGCRRISSGVHWARLYVFVLGGRPTCIDYVMLLVMFSMDCLLVRFIKARVPIQMEWEGALYLGFVVTEILSRTKNRQSIFNMQTSNAV